MVFKKFVRIARHCHSKVDHQNSLRGEWKSVIGLEVHAQLSTESKLFSRAPSVYGAPTNSTVSLFDAAVPGTLPVLSKRAVELAVLSALALGCKINPVSHFDRKHYFYSDLPAGYQITQQRSPIAEDGMVEYAIYIPGTHKKPYYKKSRIKQVQLEQDSGKSLHDHTERRSYVDLNRAGFALVEIVFQPDVEDAHEACALVKEVIRILEKVGSCSCKLEEGAFRVDANVSVHRDGEELGVRTEIKNLGSINGVWNAISFEVNRQTEILRSGGTVKNATLGWDQETHKTKPMRDKEEKQDYRFMPEPNLPPLRFLIDEYSEKIHKNVKSKDFVFDLRHLREKIPRLPQDERTSLIKKYGFSDVAAYNLVNQDVLLTYFTEIMEGSSSRDPRAVYLLLMYQLLNNLKMKNLEPNECSVRSSDLGELVDLLQKRRITRMTCDHLLERLLDKKNCSTPIEMVQENNLFLISSTKELRKICLRIIEKEGAVVALYKRKKKKTIFNELVKKVIEESKFRADTKVLPRIMTEVLDEVNEEK